MKIRPKNIPIFQTGGISTVTLSDPNSNWFTRVGNHGILAETYKRLKTLYDKYLVTKSEEDYKAYENAVNELNNDLKKYALGYYTYTAGNNQIFNKPFVSEWLDIIKQKYPYINSTIGNRWSLYSIQSKNPNTLDNSNSGWVSDGYWAAITLDRTPWGYINTLGDHQEYNEWARKFRDIGIDYYADNNVLYGRLNKEYLETPVQQSLSLNAPPSQTNDKIRLNLDTKDLKLLETFSEIPASHKEYKNKFWQNLKDAASKIANNPNLLATGRLAGSLLANERIYDEALKGIQPELRQTYNTYRLVLGDEATKLAYYRRAALGLARAARPFTSDADKQMAYQFEAKRIGDELRALGDLADNQEIRRTSDEANQHQWANALRAAEVANANMASIVRANALKHNLKAQKMSAQWTSIDDYLQGIEYRKRQQQAEDDSINKSIYQLTRATEIENDPELLDIKAQIEAASKKPENLKDSYGQKVVNYDTPEMKQLLAKKKVIERRIQIESLQGLQQFNRKGNLWFLKSGSKITHKKKDDLLYKSVKDSVEHFRKMSKMSSDSHNRKKSKIEKLISHPKGSTRKYLLGGLAPFVIYKPVALGGETTTSSQTDTSGTTNKTSAKDSTGQEFLKDLFKLLQTEGIPSDVNAIFASINNLMEKRLAFGEELSTEDITTAYLKSMLQMNTVKFNKALYDAALKIVNEKDAISEYAVNQYGQLAVQNRETGKIEYVSPDEIDINKQNPLRNGDILNYRAYFGAFDNNLLQVASNATSMKEIAEFLKALLPKIESSEIEGYTKKGSNLIKAGIQQLLREAPEGDYKYEEISNSSLAQLALDYLYNILPKNMKSVLDIHSGGHSKELIAELVGSQSKTSLRVDAVTGKAAKDSESTDKIKSNPLLAMLREIGGTPINYSIITRDSNTMLSVDGTGYPTLHKVNKDMSVEEMLAVSGIGLIVLSKSGITFGDLRINPENLKDIMYSNTGRNAIVTLPCKIVNGSKLVNLDVIREYEEAEEKALQVAERGTEQFERVLGLKLKEAHLDSLLTSDGKPNKKMFSEFLIVEGYTTDKIPIEDKKSLYIEKVNNPDSGLEERIIKALSTDSKNSNYAIDVKDKFALFELTYDDVYRGTIFIPINNNPAAALLNDSVNVLLSTELEELYLISNKSDKYVKDNSF